MVVKIDKHGHLYINRKGGWLVQRCPWTADEDGECCRCGDWCPHFSEPVSYYPEYKKYTIVICHNKNISCDKLIDERGDKAIKEMEDVCWHRNCAETPVPETKKKLLLRKENGFVVTGAFHTIINDHKYYSVDTRGTWYDDVISHWMEIPEVEE